MTHVTTGRTALSHVSEAISRVTLGTPPGWTLCGYLALVAYTAGKYSMWVAVYALVNSLLREPDHCFKALQRSIERASQ
ncbi:hypothetical protein ParaMal1_00022 [Paracoccus phage ParMal1]|uniref:Uncharacterized protein n=1 Tax=Paracoccus phage ParMal1 TaxID=3032416 RepID=A0AAF0FJV9_9CAUD|nr:hypothetical protein ParaMal1_00022 [Paracoccus phage ParMal1]